MSKLGSSDGVVESRLPEGAEVVCIALDPGGPVREVLLLRDEQGAVRAYENLCQHIPIPLDAGGRTFLDATGNLVCATHGATYRRSDGLCIGGPCRGRSLRALRVEIALEGRVRIFLDDA